MDAGFVALVIFVAVLIMLGFCLARVRGLTREIDLLRASVLGNVGAKTDKTQQTIANVLSNKALLDALGGGTDE